MTKFKKTITIESNNEGLGLNSMFIKVKRLRVWIRFSKNWGHLFTFFIGSCGISAWIRQEETK